MKFSKSGLASGYNTTWLKNRMKKDNSPVIGGLADEDAFDERPVSSSMTANKLRSNEVRTPFKSNSDSKSDSKKLTLQDVIRIEASKRTTKVNQVKKAQRTAQPVKQEAEEIPDVDNNPLKLTTKNVRSHHLPDFIHKDNRWTARFLPTAYYRLYISKAPFDEFSLGSLELPNIVQDIVKKIYGRDAGKYIVKGKSDPILLTVSFQSKI